MGNHKGVVYMKADCNGCTALRDRKCVLGYRIELERDAFSGTALVPMEVCPKPRTVKKLREIQQQAKKP